MITKNEFIQKIKEEANYQRVIKKEAKELFSFLTSNDKLSSLEDEDNSQKYEQNISESN